MLKSKLPPGKFVYEQITILIAMQIIKRKVSKRCYPPLDHEMRNAIEWFTFHDLVFTFYFFYLEDYIFFLYCVARTKHLCARSQVTPRQASK